MNAAEEILKEALTLRAPQKAKLIDKLLLSLDKPDSKIDELWAEEAEKRIDAYESGDIKTVPWKRFFKSISNQ